MQVVTNDFFSSHLPTGRFDGLRAEAVILSAGASRRMGEPKALLRLRPGVTFLKHLIGVYAPFTRRVCVVVAGEGAIAEEARRLGADVVVVPDGLNDRFDSVASGLASVGDGSFAFLQDVDRPLVTSPILISLLRDHNLSGFAAPDIEGRAGHPLLLAPSLVRTLAARPAAATLRDALRDVPCTLVRVDAHDCDIDVDTPDDYRRLIHREVSHARSA